MQWASSRAVASIGVSGALTQAMRQIGMPVARLHTMPNGVDLDLFRIQPQTSARVELGWPEMPTLLSVGNLVENKGHDIAIKALAQLPEFRLVIAGEGPERQSLEALSKQINVASRLKFLGRLEQNQLVRCYNAADILLLISSREGWPNVLLESMACGTPVIATHVGGIPEIVTSPAAGRLIPARTVVDTVKAVADLWQTLPDRAQVRSCAQACSWQSTTEAQIKLFNKITVTSLELANA